MPPAVMAMAVTVPAQEGIVSHPLKGVMFLKSSADVDMWPARGVLLSIHCFGEVLLAPSRTHNFKDMVQLLCSITVTYRIEYRTCLFKQDALGVTVAISGEGKLSLVGLLFCNSM